MLRLWAGWARPGAVEPGAAGSRGSAAGAVGCAGVGAGAAAGASVAGLAAAGWAGVARPPEGPFEEQNAGFQAIEDVLL